MSRTTTAPSGLATVGRRFTRTIEIAITTSIAWAFGLATAGVLLYVASGLWTGQSKAATPLSVTHPAMTAEPWGLTFVGLNGAYLATGMAAGVLIALGMSMMVASGPRRLGLLLVLGWAGLWVTDAVVLIARSWTGSWWTAGNDILAGTLALFVVFACMFHRATRLWRIKVTV